MELLLKRIGICWQLYIYFVLLHQISAISY